MVGLIKFTSLVSLLVLVQSCSNLYHQDVADRRKKESLRMFKETQRVRKKLSNRRSNIRSHKGKRYYS